MYPRDARIVFPCHSCALNGKTSACAVYLTDAIISYSALSLTFPILEKLNDGDCGWLAMAKKPSAAKNRSDYSAYTAPTHRCADGLCRRNMKAKALYTRPHLFGTVNCVRAPPPPLPPFAPPFAPPCPPPLSLSSFVAANSKRLLLVKNSRGIEKVANLCKYASLCNLPQDWSARLYKSV